MILDAIKNIKSFILKNPHIDICNLEKRLPVVNQALDNSITSEKYQQLAAYKTILEDDEEQYLLKDDPALFEHLLKNIDLLIEILHREVCRDGVINLDLLENLLRLMQKDLIEDNKFDKTLGSNIGNKKDPYDLPERENPFFLTINKLEGFSRESINRSSFDNEYYDLKQKNPSIDSKKQERSEEFTSPNNNYGAPLVTEDNLLNL
jgi:hypothetical protein